MKEFNLIVFRCPRLISRVYYVEVVEFVVVVLSFVFTSLFPGAICFPSYNILAWCIELEIQTVNEFVSDEFSGRSWVKSELPRSCVKIQKSCFKV